MYSLGVVVVVVVAAVVWLLVANKSSDGSKSSADNMSSMDKNSGSDANSSSGKPVATDAVTIQNFAFSPADISVKVGTKVTWINKDSATHTVTETDGQTGPDSGDLQSGSSYSFTFANPGTYHYHCALHPGMVGTVTVSNQ